MRRLGGLLSTDKDKPRTLNCVRFEGTLDGIIATAATRYVIASIRLPGGHHSSCAPMMLAGETITEMKAALVGYKASTTMDIGLSSHSITLALPDGKVATWGVAAETVSPDMYTRLLPSADSFRERETCPVPALCAEALTAISRLMDDDGMRFLGSEDSSDAVVVGPNIVIRCLASRSEKIAPDACESALKRLGR